MLFVAEYDVQWDMLEAAAAKRLEWNEVDHPGFRFVGEYVWPAGDPAFRGVAVFHADSVELVNAFVLHYGPSITMRVHPASDVVSSVRALKGESASSAGRRAQTAPD
jgi:hypothetical protein